MVSRIANLVYDLSHYLWDNFRLKILEKKEILGISQVWVVTKKWRSAYSSSRTRKSRYQTFLDLSSFTEFFYFVQNILSKIVWENKCLVLTRSGVLQTLVSWHFVYHQSIFPTFVKNIRQVSCAKVPNLTVLCKQYFVFLV